MKGTRDGYLAAASIATGLLAEAAVARQWDHDSALPAMQVSALAGHLARQIFSLEEVLSGEASADPPISLPEHYARSRWVDAGLDDEANVFVRKGGAAEAAAGPAALTARARGTLARLAARLPALPPGLVVLVPWGPWPLTLDDFLVTRMMEIAVHSDDLAQSVGLPTPVFPAEVADAVIVLLARLATRRHGAPAVIRAFSRAERAPEHIAAF
ncbi:MAG TPA: maleylpyruvate isomerase N-terminal domain-containing protein [Streptosporangiaceae bacterium]|nr:maleylpyruvate isomerase N-terminal domain-containing protein [Streptosporangiaceae bacterium]